MNSGKQKSRELTLKRAHKRFQTEKLKQAATVARIPASERVNTAALVPTHSYGLPDFVRRGYYMDTEFSCCECGKIECWSATQQKWWYEVAKGHVESRATRCATCRRKRREHRERSIAGAKEKKRRNAAK